LVWGQKRAEERKVHGWKGDVGEIPSKHLGTTTTFGGAWGPGRDGGLIYTVCVTFTMSLATNNSLR